MEQVSFTKPKDLYSNTVKNVHHRIKKSENFCVYLPQLVKHSTCLKNQIRLSRQTRSYSKQVLLDFI